MEELRDQDLPYNHAMQDDPRLKRVLKRYPKAGEWADASMDVSAVGLTALQQAVGAPPDDLLMSPRELDERAQAWLAANLGMPFEDNFDYYLHVYVRRECDEEYFRDPGARTATAPPEDGPPAKLLATGMRWASTRPKNGKENYVGVPVDDGPAIA